jgi:hypothetical protein
MEGKMKLKTLFTNIVLSLVIILGLGITQAPTRAVALDRLAVGESPDDPQTPQAGSKKWNLLYIDGLQDNVNIGSDASIAFDLTRNTPYISYYNHNTHNLVLASPVTTGGNCGSGKWWCRNVETTTDDIGLGSSIAIHDKVSTVAGKLGISYYDATHKRLKFAQWACTLTTCKWTIYSFFSGDANLDPGRYSSLKYDSQGLPHIAYFMNWNLPGNPTSYVKYCSWVGTSGNDAGGAFSCVDVVQRNALNNGLYPSLALDPNDHPRIAYYDGQFGNLGYAQEGANGSGTCYSNNWWCDWIDFTGDVGKFPSMDIVKVSGSTEIHIAYYDATNGKLKHAWMTPNKANCGPLVAGIYVWRCDTVDTMGVGITWPAISLTLDNKANPYIAYQDYSADTNDLKIARYPGTLGLVVGNCGTVPGLIGPYQCDVLDTGGHGGAETNDGFFPSIVRNSSGLIYIAYKEYDYFYEMGTLKLAYQNFLSFMPFVGKKK